MRVLASARGPLKLLQPKNDRFRQATDAIAQFRPVWVAADAAHLCLPLSPSLPIFLFLYLVPADFSQSQKDIQTVGSHAGVSLEDIQDLMYSPLNTDRTGTLLRYSVSSSSLHKPSMQPSLDQPTGSSTRSSRHTQALGASIRELARVMRAGAITQPSAR